MTIFLEDESAEKLPLDCEQVAERVLNTCMEDAGCPYEAQVSILLTTDEGIHEINRAQRGIDSATDVLSFPETEYPAAGDFSFLDEGHMDCFEPDSGELMLGDIVISTDHVRTQAEEYGHSLLREYAFLLAHSALHLIGYDHMTDEDARIMEQKQEDILQKLGITRE